MTAFSDYICTYQEMKSPFAALYPSMSAVIATKLTPMAVVIYAKIPVRLYYSLIALGTAPVYSNV